MTTYTYDLPDLYHRPTATSSAATTTTPSSTTSYAYQYNGEVTSHTDALGRVLHIDRDSRHLPTAIVEAYGTPTARTTNIAWRSDWQIAQIQAPGLTTDYGYDTSGRLTSVTQTDTTSSTYPYITNGQTRTWTYTYTAKGLLASANGPLAGSSDTINYTYNTAGYLTSVTDEIGHVTTITAMDGAGRPTSVTDQNGIVTNYTYSPAGYLTRIAVDPTGANQITDFAYNGIGQVTSVNHVRR